MRLTSREEQEIRRQREQDRRKRERFEERQRQNKAEREARRKSLYHTNGRPKQRLVRVFPEDGGTVPVAKVAKPIKDWRDPKDQILEIAKAHKLDGNFIAVCTDPTIEGLFEVIPFTSTRTATPIDISFG